MTNIDQVCLFFNLITIPVQCCGFWDRCRGISSFLTHFKVIIHWGIIKILKGVEMTEKDQISKGESFFFHQSKHLSYFVPVIRVSPDTTVEERCLG